MSEPVHLAHVMSYHNFSAYRHIGTGSYAIKN